MYYPWQNKEVVVWFGFSHKDYASNLSIIVKANIKFYIITVKKEVRPSHGSAGNEIRGLH